MSSNQSANNRVKSLEQLGELAGGIVTQAPDSSERTRDTFQPKGHRNRNDRPQEDREFQRPQTHAPRREFRMPDPEQVLREINERVPQQRNGDLPTLPDFIMMLQEHEFSLEMRNPNMLKRFVKAQQVENRFYRIAYSGGDPYMAALQMYIQYAVDRAIAKRAPPKPQAQKAPREPRVSREHVVEAAQTIDPAANVESSKVGSGVTSEDNGQ